MYVTNPDILLQLLTLIGYEKPLNACLLFEIDFQITSTLQENSIHFQATPAVFSHLDIKPVLSN